MLFLSHTYSISPPFLSVDLLLLGSIHKPHFFSCTHSHTKRAMGMLSFLLWTLNVGVVTLDHALDSLSEPLSSCVSLSELLLVAVLPVVRMALPAGSWKLLVAIAIFRSCIYGSACWGWQTAHGNCNFLFLYVWLQTLLLPGVSRRSSCPDSGVHLLAYRL